MLPLPSARASHSLCPEEMGNAFIKSVNGSFRVECLKAFWLLGLAYAWLKCDVCCADYNEVHPHGSIAQNTRVE